MIRKDFYSFLGAALLALALSGTAARAAGTAPGGTTVDTIVSIVYQATPGGVTEIVSSNDAGVTVSAPAAGVSLTPASGRQGISWYGRSVFPVTLSNTGNGTDTDTLTVTPALGWKATLIYDNYGNGVLRPGENTPVSGRVTLAAGKSQAFFLLVTPTGSLQSNASGTVTLKAVSGTDATKSALASALTTISAG